jgi:hypothetical protein
MFYRVLVGAARGEFHLGPEGSSGAAEHFDHD